VLPSRHHFALGHGRRSRAAVRGQPCLRKPTKRFFNRSSLQCQNRTLLLLCELASRFADPQRVGGHLGIEMGGDGNACVMPDFMRIGGVTGWQRAAAPVACRLRACEEIELVKKSGVGSIRAAEFSLAPPAGRGSGWGLCTRLRNWQTRRCRSPEIRAQTRGF
jgi:hypothetical protein